MGVHIYNEDRTLDLRLSDVAQVYKLTDSKEKAMARIFYGCVFGAVQNLYDQTKVETKLVTWDIPTGKHKEVVSFNESSTSPILQRDSSFFLKVSREANWDEYVELLGRQPTQLETEYMIRYEKGLTSSPFKGSFSRHKETLSFSFDDE